MTWVHDLLWTIAYLSWDAGNLISDAISRRGPETARTPAELLLWNLGKRSSGGPVLRFPGRPLLLTQADQEDYEADLRLAKHNGVDGPALPISDQRSAF